MNKRSALTIIQATHASLDGRKSVGLLDRHRRLLQEYAKTFEVVVYSSDTTDYSAELGVAHKPVPWLPQGFGWRHLVFYLWLVWQAPRMKGVIKVFGSNIPTLPLVRWLSGRPMMVTYEWDYSRGTRLNEKTGLKHWLAPVLERLALATADLVLVTTEWLGDKVRNVYHKRTVLLPNWVDLRQVETQDGATARSDCIVLYAGRLHWIKGVDVLVEAFAQAKRHQPQARLVICGTGEEEERLRVQVKSLGLAGVEFRGRVPNAEVLRLMSSAAVSVLPTLTMEGHPKALIEAMACGAACVASDVPGNRDVIANGETGILVPPSDVGALSRVLERLLSDRPLRDRLGQAARVEASRYSFSDIVPRDVQALAALDTTR